MLDRLSPPTKTAPGIRGGGLGGRLSDLRSARPAPPSRQIQDFLFGQSLEVRLPLFEGDADQIREEHYETLKECEGVLMFWGKAKEGWLRTMLRDLNKVFGLGRTEPYKAASLYLAELPDPAKESFRTRQVSIIRPDREFEPGHTAAPSLTSWLEPSMNAARTQQPVSRAFGPSRRRRRTSFSAATGKATNWCGASPAGASSPWWAPPVAASRRSCGPGCCRRWRAASWPAPARTGASRSLRPQDDPIGFLARAIVETGVLAHLDLARTAAEGVVETTLRRSSLGLVEVARLARLAPHDEPPDPRRSVRGTIPLRGSGQATRRRR